MTNYDGLPLGAGVVPTEQTITLPKIVDDNILEKEVQQKQVPEKSILDRINDDDLSTFILQKLRDDMADKEEMDWQNRRTYDVNSYYGIKRPTTFPWINASNFPVPLTSTLLDTAHSNVLGSIFSSPQDTVDVEGQGQEDTKKAKYLESILNWQMYEEIDAYGCMDKTIFRSFLNGTAFVKVIKSVTQGKIVFESIPIENIFLPLDAKGFQVGETDHVFQVIGLNEIDVEERKQMGVYKGLEDVPKGFAVRRSSLMEQVTIAKDVASGTKLDQRQRRDLTFIMECYLTYPHRENKNDREPAELVEMIVWVAPNGGKILNKVLNEKKKRPYVEFIPYPRDDRFWGESLPERIREIQEELDYAHNQNINAADIAILPPMFFRQGSDFDPELHKRVPGGAYPVPDSRDITFQQISVNPIFERQEDRYWDLAERKTGLTELFQGRSPQAKQTATLTIRRENRSEIRFKTLYQRFENSWSKLIDLVYFYDKEYPEPDKLVKVVGIVEGFKKLKDLFPEGLEGNYNFKFSSAPLTEREYRKNNSIQLVEFLMTLPIVQGDAGAQWKVAKLMSESLGEKNLELIVSKPSQANIESAEEAIQRIMGGEHDFVPDPGIDAENYILRIQLFMKTDSFMAADNKTKAALLLLLMRADALRKGQIQQMIDRMIVARGDQGLMGGMNGQAAEGGANAPVNGQGNQGMGADQGGNPGTN